MKTAMQDLLDKLIYYRDNEVLTDSQKLPLNYAINTATELIIKEHQELIKAFDSGAYAGAVKADISGHAYLLNKYGSK